MSIKVKPGCPLCGKDEDPIHRPFCSRGCKDRDLINWLGGAYAVPVLDDDHEDETGLDSEGNPSL